MTQIDLDEFDLLDLRASVRVAEGEGALNSGRADELWQRLSNILFVSYGIKENE